MSETPSSPSHDQRDALALSFARGVGCAAFRERVGRFGSASAAFAETVPRAERAEASALADSALDAARRAGARLLVLGESEYPASLLDLADPPSCLFALGSLDVLRGPVVSIVGTRHSSLSAERATRRLAGVLAQAGACVVSGLARGIDGCAHQGALDVGGMTAAILGGGVDVPYPITHRSLHERIIARGLALSEAVPGSHPVRGAFPRRNRIIAALGRALIVVEAGERSGALITADQADDIGRPVGALPGPIDAPQCVGSNALLRRGVVVITSVDDALVLAGLTNRRPGAEAADAVQALGSGKRRSPGAPSAPMSTAADPQQAAVLSAIQEGAADVSALLRHTRLSPRQMTAALASLELAGALWTDHAGAVRLA